MHHKQQMHLKKIKNDDIYNIMNNPVQQIPKILYKYIT